MPYSNYTHLSLDERIIIDNRFKNNESCTRIARSLGRSRSTIWRELRRNGRLPYAKTKRVNKPTADARHFRGSIEAEPIKLAKERYQKRKESFRTASKLVYTARKADRKARRRIKQQLLILEREENEELLGFIITALDSSWSPEQIAGRIRLEGYYHPISVKSIYKFIYKHRELELKDYLPRHGKKYHKKAITVFNQSDGRRSIDDRPKVVKNLVRIGDLEGDTIVGKDKKDRITTHVDCRSGKASLGLVLDFNASKIAKQSKEDIDRVFGRNSLHTITYDNGVEFTYWRSLEVSLSEYRSSLDDDLKARKASHDNAPKVYFAHPYHSWERGRNENLNGLIRRFLPKGSDFKKLTKDDILEIEFLLNNRPRKRLGWKTPNEVYDDSVALEGKM